MHFLHLGATVPVLVVRRLPFFRDFLFHVQQPELKLVQHGHAPIATHGKDPREVTSPGGRGQVEVR